MMKMMFLVGLALVVVQPTLSLPYPIGPDSELEENMGEWHH